MFMLSFLNVSLPSCGTTFDCHSREFHPSHQDANNITSRQSSHLEVIHEFTSLALFYPRAPLGLQSGFGQQPKTQPWPHAEPFWYGFVGDGRHGAGPAAVPNEQRG